jgi:hypothetical protein
LGFIWMCGWDLPSGCGPVAAVEARMLILWRYLSNDWIQKGKEMIC